MILRGKETERYVGVKGQKINDRGKISRPNKAREHHET